MDIFFKFFAIVCLVNLTACTDDFISVDDMEVINEYPGTDQRLWVYFTRYENAAAERGIHIDLNAEAIIGTIENTNLTQPVQETIEDMSLTDAMGSCNYQVNQPNQLIIDSGFWKRVSNSRRELIVFHELGHCHLKRDHNEATNEAGICESIMRSGTTNCFDFYNSNTRKEKLDELFSSF